MNWDVSMADIGLLLLITVLNVQTTLLRIRINRLENELIEFKSTE